MSSKQFLQGYWQKRPLLIRNAFPNFEPPVQGDDLAGLSCEQEVESRLVLGSVGQPWSLEHGPIAESRFETLPENNWTLLVQDVEKHIPEVAKLLQPFSFLPNWRVDDVMVSYSAPGGSVGPHTDQYDVFLLQGLGRRRWQWSQNFDATSLPDCDLKMLANFSAENEAVLQPGDMLYLPPGVAHHGVALDAGLTFSVGLRSPDSRQLMLELAQAVAQKSLTPSLLCDAGRAVSTSPTLLEAQDRHALRAVLRQGLQFDDAALDELLGCLLTRPKENLRAEEQEPTSSTDFGKQWASGDRPCANAASRFVHYQSDGGVLLFANGVPYRLTLNTFTWLAPWLKVSTQAHSQANGNVPLDASPPLGEQEKVTRSLLAAGCLQWRSELVPCDLPED